MTTVRKNVVFVVLLGLLGVLGVSLATRSRSEHTVTAPTPSAEPSTPSGSASASAAASTQPAASASSAPTPSPDKKGLGRPLRVTGLGWDVLAPVLLANGGTAQKKGSELAKAKLDVVVQVAEKSEAVESALARGGADEAGADLAVVPLPMLVAGYERLQALRPVVFFVTAWSRGRDVLVSKTRLDKLPASGEVALRGEADAASTALALFVLDLAGVAPGRVRLGDTTDAKATISATLRSSLAADERTDILLGTAEASRYVPIVAVAPASLLEAHPEAARAFVLGWLGGQKALAADPSGAARTIAALPEAPEPIELLSRLGELEATSLPENAQLLGLSGRDAVNLESLFQRTWRLAREAKLLGAPPPELAPIHTRAVASLARSEKSPGRTDAAPAAKKDGPRPPPDRPLLVERLSQSLEPDDVVAELGFVAGVFRRAPVRVTQHRGAAADKKGAEALIGRTLDRYGLDPGRLTPGTATAKPGTGVTIEVLPIP